MDVSDFFCKALDRLKKPDRVANSDPIVLDNWFLQQTDSIYFTDCFYLIGDLQNGQTIQTGIIVHAYFADCKFIDASGDIYLARAMHPRYLDFLQKQQSPLLNFIANPVDNTLSF